MTNYEKIKDMSIDEMADNIYINSKDECDFCTYHYPGCIIFGITVELCKKGIKKWLKSEATDGQSIY